MQSERWERQERLAAGKPRTRLARIVRLPAQGIDSLALGMTREQVQTALSESRSIRVQKLPDGLNVLFLNEPFPSATHWPRQLFVHLGFLRRQDGPLGQVLQAYSWNDDQTRVRIFAQETVAGLRLFTEWRTWLLPARTLAVADDKLPK